MKLTTNQWALLDQVNLCRISIRNQLQTQKIQKSKLLECMCQLEPYLYDSNLHIHGIKQFEEENVLNIAKIMKAQYTQQTPKKYKINSNEYDIFKKKMDQENQKKKIQKSQTFPLLKNLKIQNNDKKEKQQIENKQLFDKRSKQQEKKNQISNNQNLEKIPQFIAASTLAKNTSVRKKFVPPFKKPEVQKEIIEEKKYQDPRLKNLDPKLIASIESEILDNNAPIKWSDIAGLGFAKKTIHQMIVWPMLRPDIFKGIRAPPKSILLFGPPGTGKTLIGKAIASQSNSTFFNISASSLTSKWVGQGEKMVKTLFLVAQVKQPSVIFIDEIDSLLCARSQNQQQSSRRIKTQFLVQLDGAKSNTDQRILIIGATNRPQELDDAVRRRFIKRLYIPLPNYEGRVQLFTTLSKQNTFDLNEKDINQISLLTKGFSGADLTSLSSQSALIPIRRLSSKIQNIEGTQVPATTLNDLKEGLKLVRPSVNMNQLKGYQQWNAEFGSYQFNNDSINLDT